MTQTVGLLWTSDQPVEETYTWQHTTLITDRHPCSLAKQEIVITTSETLQPHDLERAATVIGRNLIPVLNKHHVLTRMDKWLWSCTVPHFLNFGCKCLWVLCSVLLTFGHFRYAMVGSLGWLQCQTDWLTYGFVPLPEIEYQIPDRRSGNIVSCPYLQHFIIFMFVFYRYGFTVEKPVKNKLTVNCLDVRWI
jgi:hypothetical protein